MVCELTWGSWKGKKCIHNTPGYSPTFTAVSLRVGLKAKTDIPYQVAEKYQPEIAVYTKRMISPLRDFCIDPRVCKVQLYEADTSHRPLTNPDPRGRRISYTHTGIMLTPSWPWEKDAREIQNCWKFWPWLPSSWSARTSPAMALCSAPSPSPCPRSADQETNSCGTNVIPSFWLCLRAPSHCPFLPFCIHDVPWVCKHFGAATAPLHMALMDTVLGQPEGAIRINVNNNNSDKQHQH